MFNYKGNKVLTHYFNILSSLLLVCWKVYTCSLTVFKLRDHHSNSLPLIRNQQKIPYTVSINILFMIYKQRQCITTNHRRLETIQWPQSHWPHTLSVMLMYTIWEALRLICLGYQSESYVKLLSFIDFADKWAIRFRSIRLQLNLAIGKPVHYLLMT